MSTDRQIMGIRGGIRVDLLSPRPEDFQPELIARTLANEPRYAGNYKAYSVAQHAVLVMEYARYLGATWSEQLAALHHDDTEAITGDLPRPVKNACPDFRALEKRLNSAVEERYGINTNAEVVKRADYAVFYSEVHRLVPPDARWIYTGDLPVTPAGPLVRWVDLVPWSPDKAFARYMDAHEVLSK